MREERSGLISLEPAAHYLSRFSSLALNPFVE